jgi:hypothetical protein
MTRMVSVSALEDVLGTELEGAPHVNVNRANSAIL